MILSGDSLEVLPTLDSGRFSACVTDPPYELNFMSRTWDNTGIAYNVDLWREVLRVLKPGAHLIAFGGSRTYHRLAVAVEDAGFDIRDQGLWLYGSGFPKSLDVSKAIEAHVLVGGSSPKNLADAVDATGQGIPAVKEIGPMKWADDGTRQGMRRHEAGGWDPTTPDARKWEGWGTALKPAHEPFVIARKPFKGTVAANVLEHGTGAINVDGGRVGGKWINPSAGQGAGFDAHNKPGRKFNDGLGGIVAEPHPQGRFPANLIHDGSPGVVDLLRGASGYFYCAKASRAEREAGLDHLDPSTGFDINGRKPENVGHEYAHAGAGRTASTVRNVHPTVKPLSLMRYLVRLVTPPGGEVLDPFAGSGSTLCAAAMGGFTATGIELTPDYIPIIEGRVAHWTRQRGALL